MFEKPRLPATNVGSATVIDFDGERTGEADAMLMA
jgi:hypothetical protein